MIVNLGAWGTSRCMIIWKGCGNSIAHRETHDMSSVYECIAGKKNSGWKLYHSRNKTKKKNWLTYNTEMHITPQKFMLLNILHLYNYNLRPSVYFLCI